MLQAIEKVNLRSLLSEVLESKQPLLKRKGLDLHCEVPSEIMISGDKFLLHEALANLVQNAVDFSGKNEEIRITGRLEGRSVKIIIEDHGPGIPDYAIDKVFDKFYSLQRPETGKKSTGLGLNFVRQVASLHSGDILLENRESRGTRAILSLPV